MFKELESLQRRVRSLEHQLLGVAICCSLLMFYLLLSASGHMVKASSQPDVLTLKRLAIVDGKGTERVVIAAPLPDPIVQGTRVHRDGPVSGLLRVR